MLKINKQQLTEAISFDDDVQDLISKGDWSSAYNAVLSAEGQEELVSQFLNAYEPFKDIQDKIELIKQPLTRQILNMKSEGFYKETNPFLEFLPNLLNAKTFTAGTLDAEDFKELNNMWSDGTISDRTLRNSDINNNILLHSDLYDKDDMKFIVQAYSWLSDKKNVDSSFDEAIAKDNIKLRDSIIFDKNGVRDAQSIKNTIAELERQFGKEPEDDDKDYTPEKYTEEQIDNILNAGKDKFNKESVNLLLNYLSDRGFIK